MYLDCLDKLKNNLECCKSKLCSKCCEDKKEKLFTITYEFDDFTIPPIVDESQQNRQNTTASTYTKYSGNEQSVKIYVNKSNNKFEETINIRVVALDNTTCEIKSYLPKIEFVHENEVVITKSYITATKIMTNVDLSRKNSIIDVINKQSNKQLDSVSNINSDIFEYISSAEYDTKIQRVVKLVINQVVSE